jgi:hypothetical protein
MEPVCGAHTVIELGVGEQRLNRHTRIRALEDECLNLLPPLNLALEINEAIINRSNTVSVASLRIVGRRKGQLLGGTSSTCEQKRRGGRRRGGR